MGEHARAIDGPEGFAAPLPPCDEPRDHCANAAFAATTVITAASSTHHPVAALAFPALPVCPAALVPRIPKRAARIVSPVSTVIAPRRSGGAATRILSPQVAAPPRPQLVSRLVP